MSQTENLLKNLSNSGLLKVAEEHFVIGKDRNITVPNGMKRLAVQNDHDIETITFDCPRFWDGQDMSKMTIYVNYLRADSKTGAYRAENVVVDKHLVDTMHFDWTISRNVSEVHGKLAFQICIKKTDDNGNELTHWNSEVCKDCFISESLNCSNEDIVELLPDIIDQWYKELIEKCESGEFNGPQGVSPTIEITDIQGGHHVSITDINGTQHFDVMDSYVDSSEAVRALFNTYTYRGPLEPIKGPALWFKGELNGTSYQLIYKDPNNVLHTIHPATKLENVDGIDTITEHFDNRDNPHDVTPEQIGLVKNEGVVTLGNGAAYTATVPGINKLVNGASFVMIPNVANTTAAPTLNVNNLGAKVLARSASGRYGPIAVSSSEEWIKRGFPIRVTYYENYWVIDDAKPYAADLHGVVKIQNGGTNASDAETARQNLGAAAEDHSHKDLDEAIRLLKSYFHYSGGVYKMAVQECNNTDLNELTTQGLYWGYTGLTNAAVQNVSVIEVLPYSNDWVLQRQTVITTDPTRNATYIRTKYSGTTWSAWSRVLTNIVHPDDRGNELPAAGTPGRIFYKKVNV